MYCTMAICVQSSQKDDSSSIDTHKGAMIMAQKRPPCLSFHQIYCRVIACGSNHGQPGKVTNKVLIQRNLALRGIATDAVIVARSQPANVMHASRDPLLRTRNLHLAGDTTMARWVSGIVTAGVCKTVKLFAGSAYEVATSGIPLAIRSPGDAEGSVHAAEDTVWG